MKSLANEIVKWLKSYAENNTRKALVVGVSGGVDSALVSTLCAKTGLPTYCVILPCQSKSNGISLAQAHARWLRKKYPNVKDVYMDLSPCFGLFEANVPADFRFVEKAELAFANAKSRLRMVALYQVATTTHGCVVGTGNKVEDFGVGFFTKYGDGGVDVSPIGDLTKTEVRAMARALGVSATIVNVAPTDGLWADNRTDESALGATYEELEWAMANADHYAKHGTQGMTPRQREVMDIYNKRHAVSQHKLHPIPVFRKAEPMRMTYESYARLKNLISLDIRRLEGDFQSALNFIPSENFKPGAKSGLDKAHRIFSDAYGTLEKMKEELHAAAAATYLDHPNPKMKEFWGVK
jgi:NAD+ synthase